MSTPPPPGFEQELAELTREFALVCGRDGTVRWCDQRAADRLALGAGVSLFDHVVPGGADKLRRLLEGRPEPPARGEGDGAAAAPDDAWELHLAGRDRVFAAALRARHRDDDVVVVGSLVPADHAALLEQMSDAMSEMATLHRTLERQRRELTVRRTEVSQLTRDLDDSGLGMQALYAELDEKADAIRTVSEQRSRLVANMSHELRTPLSSIVGLTKLLLSRIDGDLGPEQERQVTFIRQSAEELLELVNDLLDLTRLDVGKLRFRPRRFTVESLFGALRGQLRALVVRPEVRLVFGDATGLPELDTDEAKLAQVLRNFISNALKFTERGEVRVEAHVAEDGRHVTFAVHDTGIGIAPEDQERIFDEFLQLDTPLHQQARGTGLGLSVVRRLTQMLEGTVRVASAPGQGSTFSVTVPLTHPEAAELAELEERRVRPDPTRAPVLVVEDDTKTVFLYERYLAGSGFQVVPARTVEQARDSIARLRPAAIVLDIVLEGEQTWQFLTDLKTQPGTRDIPVIVVTVMDRERKARALGADEFFVKPLDRDWLLRRLRTIGATTPVEKILVIDDDDVARYLIRRLLADTRYALLEAEDGPAGVQLAREERPDVIILDFVLPTMTAFEVLDQLKADPVTRAMPVIISTSKHLDEHERLRLEADTAAIIPKDRLSREVAIQRIREVLEKTMRVGIGGLETVAIGADADGGATSRTGGRDADGAAR